jgi:HAMP domain-containing protein/HPt (histidine-containing phosphotransfer) domain-containing protein
MIFALVATVSLVVALELTRRERERSIASKSGAGAMLVELFAASITPALDFADSDALNASLTMLSRNTEVVDAVVWPMSGDKPLARLRSSDDIEPPPDRALGIRVFENYLDIGLVAANPAGKQLGAVAVRVSLARENAAFAAVRRRIYWLALGLSALVAALLMGAVRRTIISPLAKLEQAARRLARGELSEVIDLRHDEVGSLGDTFNRMGRAIREREDRIHAMTDRLQGLLDNMRQAIVVFDASGHLGVERSRPASQIFGNDSGPNTSIVDLLYPPDRSSDVEREAFRAWISAAGESEAPNFDDLSDLAPKEVTLHFANGDDRLLELEFRSAAIDPKPQRFMLLATDVTFQRKLERTAETQERDHQKQLVAMRRLLAGGGQQFVRFLASARDRLARTERQLCEVESLAPEPLDLVFRFVHTLRAEARSFDLKRVETLANELELELAGSRHSAAGSELRAIAYRRVVAGLAQLASELDQAENLFVSSSPIGRRVLEQVTVLRQDVDGLFVRFGHQQDELGRLVSRLAARPFGELVSALPDGLERWTSREGKRAELVVTGREALVPAALCQKLGGVLAHLIRNSVAHGIETPLARRAAGKPEVGRIELSCKESSLGVTIEVNDDGAGFDFEALQHSARGRSFDPSTLEVAFAAGVSTRDQVDELAGYGVGLGAVRNDLGEAGYSVSLSSQTAHGARVLIEPAITNGEPPCQPPP